MSKSVEDAYSERKMNEINYDYVNKEISILYDKIFRKSLIALLNSTEDDIGEQLSKLKNEIEITHSEQKITELQFNLLNKKTSEFRPKDNDKAAKEEYPNPYTIRDLIPPNPLLTDSNNIIYNYAGVYLKLTTLF